MDLILWRHAQAEEGSPDHARELTAHGRKQAQRMGAWLDRVLPSGCKILSSPTARTLQTVEALGRKYRIVDAIGPDANAYEVLHAAGWPDARGPVMVVGHQPWLGQVASLLLTGVEQEWTVKKSNAWWIAQRDRDEGNTIYLKAVLAPEFFSD
ncbi:MAG: histidine phosphatase family protein [Oxalobacteraceae bacterium]|jgi:phosphohistidine phosphatase|nr:histidine phosphatase family protein [Oxalobacteraceae bacterium]